jgi:hypothetical protein
MDKVTTVGIDLAKRVFALHGVDAKGRIVLRKTVRREQFVQTVATLPPCLIGMEACSGSHEWVATHHSHRSSGVKPVRFAMRTSMRGPIVSLS